MMRTVLLPLFVLSVSVSPAQQFTGQWKGSFVDKSSAFGNFSGDKCDYVLELDVKGRDVNGFSYTYFTEGGKRYYTICKLEGFVDPKKKYIEVKEIERTKTNIPSTIRNCFQVHRLTYFKQGDTETIEGDWLPAPRQEGNCGFGSTQLTRRSLASDFPTVAAKQQKAAENRNAPVMTKNQTSAAAKTGMSKKTSPSSLPETAPLPLAAAPALPAEKTNEKEEVSSPRLDSRRNTILKTIEVEHRDVRVDFYDNGEIDGDSVSVYFNGKQVLANRKLTDRALTLNLRIEDKGAANELVMFAENLGSIPPNTAIMVVTDGPNRYEIRITSDLEKSGAIRFVLK